MLPKLSEITDYGPKYVDSGPVTEVVQRDGQASLKSMPVLKSFAGDAGKFITFGLTVTKHPDTDIRNMGVYRIQIIDDKKAIMHWQIHKRGAQHYQISKEQKKERVEVAIIIGADPATIFSAVAPVPEGTGQISFCWNYKKKRYQACKVQNCRFGSAR